MKKIICIISLSLTLHSIVAQQSAMFSQFMMNDYGLNPATAGNSKGWQLMLGRRIQWRNFAGAPQTHFVGVTKDLGKKAYKNYWHGIGLYGEQDKSGMFENQALYGTYAFHLKLSKNYGLSFGLNVGIKRALVKSVLFDPNDPALATANAQLLLYPDFVPGLYLTASKFAMSVSVRNLYKNTLQQGSKKIGAPSKLIPTAYITLSKKFSSSGYDFTFVPSIHLQSTFINLPLAHFNLMAYYQKRIGIGFTYRLHDAISGIIQVRIFDNLVIGFAYDYTISRFRSANANSTEIMAGFTPVMSSDDYRIKNNVAACPKLDF